MSLTRITAKSVSRVVATLLVIGALALVYGLVAGSVLGGRMKAEPSPAKALSEEVSASIAGGRVNEVQGTMDARLGAVPDVLTFMVVDRAGEIIAAKPKSLIGQNLEGFDIHIVRYPLGALGVPVRFERQGGPGRFAQIVFQGHDPDDGRVAIHFVYCTSPDGRGYVVLSSWLRSAELLARTQWLRQSLDGVDGIVRISFILFWLALPIWVYIDAREKGANAAAWGMLTLFTNVVGWSVYMIAGPKTVRCPACGTVQDSSHRACTQCGRHLKPVCAQCGSLIESRWSFCSRCGAKIE